jgi:NAD(P)-dependent dehydrogenase (short-subunit alcohol dehydrogenase family)
VNPFRFEGRSLVITGAGSGLGRAYAEYLATRGALVTINDIKVDGEGNATAAVAAQAIAAAGGHAIANTDSVAEESGAFALIDAAHKAFGRVDAVINNAGRSIPGRFGEQDTEILERHLAVHVKGSFNVTRAAWPLLQAAGQGRVVFTTSAAGIYGVASYSCYGTAKTALIGMARCLAEEGRPHGIMTNIVMPRAHSLPRLTTEPEDPQRGLTFNRRYRVSSMCWTVADTERTRGFVSIRPLIRSLRVRGRGQRREYHTGWSRLVTRPSVRLARSHASLEIARDATGCGGQGSQQVPARRSRCHLRRPCGGRRRPSRTLHAEPG